MFCASILARISRHEGRELVEVETVPRIGGHAAKAGGAVSASMGNTRGLCIFSRHSRGCTPVTWRTGPVALRVGFPLHIAPSPSWAINTRLLQAMWCGSVLVLAARTLGTHAHLGQVVPWIAVFGVQAECRGRDVAVAIIHACSWMGCIGEVGAVLDTTGVVGLPVCKCSHRKSTQRAVVRDPHKSSARGAGAKCARRCDTSTLLAGPGPSTYPSVLKSLPPSQQSVLGHAAYSWSRVV